MSAKRGSCRQRQLLGGQQRYTMLAYVAAKILLSAAGGMLLTIKWGPHDGMHCRIKMQHAYLAVDSSLL